MERFWSRLSVAVPGLLLIAGFGASGLISGFMVGASATPVVGAILPAIISAISAGIVAFFQSQSKQGDQAVSFRILSGWVGGLMLGFFVLYFVGLILGGRARTEYWSVRRRLLPKDIRDQVMQSDIWQAQSKLKLYRFMQGEGLSDSDAAKFVEEQFSGNYVLVPKSLLSDTNKGAPVARPSPTTESTPKKPVDESAIESLPSPTATPHLLERLTK